MKDDDLVDNCLKFVAVVALMAGLAWITGCSKKAEPVVTFPTSQCHLIPTQETRKRHVSNGVCAQRMHPLKPLSACVRWHQKEITERQYGRSCSRLEWLREE